MSQYCTDRFTCKFNFVVNQEQAKSVMYQNELKNSSVTSRTLVEVCMVLGSI